MKPHAPRPAFLLLPPDPEGHTRPETLLSLSVIEQVRWLPGEGDTPAQLQIDPLTTARSRSHQVLMGKEAEALWAQLLMLNKAEWRGVQLAAQAPDLRAGLGRALALMNGAAVEPAEERAASAAASAAAPGEGAALGQALASMARVRQADQEWRDEAMSAIGNLTSQLQYLRQGIAALLPTPADFPKLQTDEALLTALHAALISTAAAGVAGAQS